MFLKNIVLLGFFIIVTLSCKKTAERDITSYEYYDVTESDRLKSETLFAVTDEEYLQYGVSVAYLNSQGDTIIPFGKYRYFGTDTLRHYANVIMYQKDSSYNGTIGIDQNEKVLFDLVIIDNGPDYFNEGLTRVLRNGKMGFANQYGEIVIPCRYDFANWFDNGKAKVTFDAVKSSDLDEHYSVESDEWFWIDKNGKKLTQEFNN
uniref:WG repeat-containing protein n=1 Tax=Roseivirga sp. TaxID=1964215 RepID=UPI00404781A6